MKLPILVGVIALLAIVATGLYITDFTAYLGNNPSTCNNCHVMDYVYEGWYHAGHSEWTTCNECHTPHALIPKYITKAQSGYHHVTAFVFGNIPDAIRAKAAFPGDCAGKLQTLPRRYHRQYRYEPHDRRTLLL